MAKKPYVGDVGTEIILAVKSLLTHLVACKMNVQKPDKTEVSWIASEKMDWPSDPDYKPEWPAAIHYFIQSGDFDQEGLLKIQGWVDLTAWQGSINTVFLHVSGVYK